MKRQQKIILALLAVSVWLLSITLVAKAQTKSLSAPDHAFLEDVERRSFRYFQEQTNPQTGLVLDRARTDAAIHDEGHRNTANIAATGFGLTSWCMAAERGWVKKQTAQQRVLNVGRSFTACLRRPGNRRVPAGRLQGQPAVSTVRWDVPAAASSTGRERPAYTQATRWVESRIIPMAGVHFQ